ncbi:DUF2071 domain-containing protein [Streptomyces flavidovirens]|uniref:YqjF family protein n=1 Tax=Streptomyces flavidovirens TaxID=67298 RepID=UPI00343435E8
MVSYEAEHHLRLPVLCAEWLNQAFVHWPYPPADVQALLPDGLTVDTYEGAAWVTVTPFLMTARPFGVPPVMLGARFLETNLRTYVRTPDGREAFWFLTIEVDWAAMLAARAVGAPYNTGRLRMRRDGGVFMYSGTRHRGGPSYRLTVRAGEPITPKERDVWLTTRWRAFTRRAGLIWDTPAEHEPWPLHAATVQELEQSLTTAVGLPAPSQQPLAHFSRGVRQVRLAPSRPRWPAAGRRPRPPHG